MRPFPAKLTSPAYLDAEPLVSCSEARNGPDVRNARVFFKVPISLGVAMFRRLLLPVILMGLVGGPMLYSHHQRRTRNNPVANRQFQNNPWQTASHRSVVDNRAQGTFPLSATQAYRPPTNFQQTSFPSSVTSSAFPTATAPSSYQFQTPVSAQSATFPPLAQSDTAWTQAGLVPDYAKAETIVYRGDANGPDLNAAPLSFTPTIDIASLFRFDITEASVTNRWQRVSTAPAVDGLHGLRVALVTGTNSWDLHGSLTYYFDTSHRVQRITYRGWTGDANRLLQILQQHQLKAQPSHWAGVYLKAFREPPLRRVSPM